MKRPMKQTLFWSLKQILFWSPRVLGILFAVFLSMFALDVFGESYGFWGTTFALLMHLIPTGVVVLAIAISWRWEWVGAFLLIAGGLKYSFDAVNRHHPDWILPIAGPAFLIGVLFLVNWLFRKQLRASS